MQFVHIIIPTLLPCRKSRYIITVNSAKFGCPTRFHCTHAQFIRLAKIVIFNVKNTFLIYFDYKQYVILWFTPILNHTGMLNINTSDTSISIICLL